MPSVHKLINKDAMLQLHDNFTIDNFVLTNNDIYDSENTKQ